MWEGCPHPPAGRLGRADGVCRFQVGPREGRRWQRGCWVPTCAIWGDQEGDEGFPLFGGILSHPTVCPDLPKLTQPPPF